MAVAYEAWRAKVHVRQPVKSTTTATCFTKKHRECRSCCSTLKRKDEKKKKKPCVCSCTSPSEVNMSALCVRVKNMGGDCCSCCVALFEYIAEYFKFLMALVCLKQPHPKFCCRLCNLLRTTAIVWQDGCDMIRSFIQCLLGMH